MTTNQPSVDSPGSAKSEWRQTIESFGSAILIALMLRSSVVEAFWVPSGSMLPTIQIGDHLFVNKLAYCLRVPFLGIELMRWGTVERNEIVVFASPPTNPSDDGTELDLIKRVVAVGGDTVEIREKKLFINGEEVQDANAHFADPTHRNIPKRDNFGPVKVPNGKFFVLGDNRDQSHDSRFWGFANESDIKGKAGFIYWSRAAGSYLPRWDRFGRLIR